jgi:hypothetical protein
MAILSGTRQLPVDVVAFLPFAARQRRKPDVFSEILRPVSLFLLFPWRKRYLVCVLLAHNLFTSDQTHLLP